MKPASLALLTALETRLRGRVFRPIHLGVLSLEMTSVEVDAEKRILRGIAKVRYFSRTGRVPFGFDKVLSQWHSGVKEVRELVREENETLALNTLADLLRRVARSACSLLDIRVRKPEYAFYDALKVYGLDVKKIKRVYDLSDQLKRLVKPKRSAIMRALEVIDDIEWALSSLRVREDSCKFTVKVLEFDPKTSEAKYSVRVFLRDRRIEFHLKERIVVPKPVRVRPRRRWLIPVIVAILVAGLIIWLLGLI